MQTRRIQRQIHYLVMPSASLCRRLTATCLILLIPWVQAEVFSSTARLQVLLESADQVEKLLEDYIHEEEARLEAIRSLMSEVKSMGNRSAGDRVKFVEHPIGAFHFIKKYAQINQQLDEGKQNKENLHAKLATLSLNMPSNGDYTGSASALLRLQRIYKLSKTELLEGSVGGLVVEPLTLEDSSVMAKKAHELQYFDQAIEWYDVALREEGPDPDVMRELRRQAALGLIDIYLKHNDFEHAESFAKWGNEAFPNDADMTAAYANVTKLFENFRSGNSTPAPPAVSATVDEQYAALCRGEVDWNSEYLSRARCRVTTDSVPYRLVKQEILSVDPFVAIYHDVLSEKEGELFREKARETMYRAMIGDPGSTTVSDSRVGQLTWLDDTNPSVKKISDRVMEITGLDVTMRPELSCSEAFQIVNYGIGGHYAPHMDVYDNKTVLGAAGGLPDFLWGSGDRLATFLFYLEDVVEGGATVFPRIGVRVPVVKNGAAFWYNLHRTGENDHRLLHAGCPVLLGQKWVANKWIRERGQEFRHSCGLTPDTPHFRS